MIQMTAARTTARRMTAKRMTAVVLLVSCSVLGLAMNQAQADSLLFEHTVDAAFEDVSVDIENAIANRGFVVDFKAAVGEMLQRTAKDVGSEQQLYTHAVTWQFCSALLSRQMMEIDRSNIAYCPYVVYAYQSADDPGQTTVGFRRHATDSAESVDILARIDAELEAIVREATE